MLLCHRYEIGEGLYIGWSSATLAICGGSCLLCACRFKTPNEKVWVWVAEIFVIDSLTIVDNGWMDGWMSLLIPEGKLVSHLWYSPDWDMSLCFRPYPYQPSSRGHVLSPVATSQSFPSNYGRNAYVWDETVQEEELGDWSLFKRLFRMHHARAAFTM